VGDPSDPLSVSVRANSLADGQSPQLPPILGTVHIPALGPWSWVSILEGVRAISRRTDDHLHQSAARVDNRLESHRSPNLQSKPSASPASARIRMLTRPTYALLSNPPATSFATSFVSSPRSFSFSAPSSLSLAVRVPSAWSIALR
jgi:hypothetical protein